MTGMLWLQLAVLLLLSVFAPVVPKNVADIEWTTSNPLFCTGESTVYVRLMDSVQLLCPSTSTKENHAVYVVDNREQADGCSVDAETDKLVLVCSPDHNPPPKSTVRFRLYSPTPGAPEFKENHDYYFISTSTGDVAGLWNAEGGLCKTNHMRIRFHVLPQIAELPENPVFPCPDILQNSVSSTLLEKLGISTDVSRRESVKTNKLYEYMADPALTNDVHNDDVHMKTRHIQQGITSRDWIVGYEPELLNSAGCSFAGCYIFILLLTCIFLDVLLIGVLEY